MSYHAICLTQYLLSWLGFLANLALMLQIGERHGIFDPESPRSERYLDESEWRR